MILSGPRLQLMPYEAKNWASLAKWAYNEQYAGLFRFRPRVLQKAEIENYPQFIGGEVFMIYPHESETPIGLIQIVPDSKTNQGFFCGLLLEDEYQKQGHSAEALAILFNYAFNRLGYRKAILEILETNTKLKEIITKAGFLKEAHYYGEVFFNGEFRDELRYCMMSSFFNKKYKGMVDSWAEH